MKRKMRISPDASGLGIRVWTAHGSWFWLLIYPERHGGATGAAPTQAEAVREARAAIELADEFAREDGPCRNCRQDTAES